MAYGVEFLQGTKGATYAAGWRIQTSGVVDNGTIVKAGNVVTGGPAADLSLGSLADDFGTSFGSKIVAQADTGDKAGVSKAVSAGTLAFSASSTQWIMRGGNVTATIGGVANTTLAGGGRDYNNKINTFSEEVARTKISDRLIGSKADEAFDMYARRVVLGVLIMESLQLWQILLMALLPSLAKLLLVKLFRANLLITLVRLVRQLLMSIKPRMNLRLNF